MADSKTKTIIIADDHILFRDTLVMYLNAARPHFHMIVVSDFYELFSALDRTQEKIDLMLVDYAMPTMMSREAFLKLSRHYHHVPMAMMSGVADAHDIDFIKQIGACGYIPKTLSAKYVVEIIDDLLLGKPFFNAMPETSLFSKNQVPEQQNLTSRECDVLDLLTTGIPNKDIADELELKTVTVKLHIRNILKKLNLKNRTQAALWARGNNKS